MVGDMGLWCVCAHCAMQVMSVTSECSVGCPTTGDGRGRGWKTRFHVRDGGDVIEIY